MSYLVLARKYRPKTFSEMVGQEHVVQALSNALSSQRLHHAYLFTGTRGVGKTTVSRILAKSLNCVGVDGKGGVTAAPCGVCEVCSAIDAGRFIDYTELDAASNRGVDEMQQLLEQAVYKPVQGRFKVFMIDEVHMLTNTAFNSMLKTLEEPPEYLKFVLATTDPQKVPVTVLSRCLQFNLRPMAPPTLSDHLNHVLVQEKIDAEPAALRLLANFAHGSMRDALSLTDQAIAFGAGRIKVEQVRQMLGSVDDRYVHGLIQALANNDGANLVERVQALRVAGLNAASALEQMTDVLHRMAICQTLSQSESSQAQHDEDQAIHLLAKALPADETQLLYSMCLHGRADLGLTSDSYAALTMILLRLLAFKPNTHVSAPLAKDAVALGKKSTTEIAAPFVPCAPSAEIEVQPLALRVHVQAQPTAKTEIHQSPVSASTEEGDFWFSCVQKLLEQKSISALPRELALQSQLVGRDENQWTLQVESESLTGAAHLENLQTALISIDYPVRLKVQIGSVRDSAAKRIAQLTIKKQQAAYDLIERDPDVQYLMRNFGGKIVEGSVKEL